MSSQEEDNDNEEIENGHISQSSFSDYSEDITSDEEGNDVTTVDGTFDTDLPVAHRYLGRLNNTSKYTVYDDGEMLDILAIHTNTLVFPGFTLPLVMNNHYENNVLNTYIKTSNSIALIAANAAYSKIYTHGTILDIFEYQHKSGILNLKARGRQRFQLVPGSEIKNLAGRLQMVTVKALGERRTDSPLIDTQLLTLKSKRPYTAREYKDFSKLAKFRRYHAAQYPFPTFVLDSYEVCVYVKQLLEGLSNYSSEYLPKDPEQLSYWFPQNYQLQHDERLHFLSISSTLERLKLAVRLLRQPRKICCENCGVELSDPTKVFAMSKDGVQSNYVNPSGHVYETVTVSEAKNFKLVGNPSKQFSWFPGYSWTIMQCRQCNKHLGWRFTSSHLKPSIFYGLANSGFKIVVNLVPQSSLDWNDWVPHRRLTFTQGYYH
ncbi:protein cereblon [Aethina tumida]|uniref:protein cereblon n=1 Tax=Aethina tumida TaxID=116153 RepID=UPI0021497419|nr:protein cereblon [Aethina tumida]